VRSEHLTSDRRPFAEHRSVVVSAYPQRLSSSSEPLGFLILAFVGLVPFGWSLVFAFAGGIAALPFPGASSFLIAAAAWTGGTGAALIVFGFALDSVVQHVRRRIASRSRPTHRREATTAD